MPSLSLALSMGLAVVAAVASNVAALYQSGSPVKVLTAADFNNNVVKGDEPHIVEFYADWCGHCQQFAGDYEKAAKALNGIIKVVAVDDQSVMQSVGVQGFPTIKARISGQWKEYSGARTASGVVDFALAQLSSLAKGRLSGKATGGKEKESKPTGPSEVVVLTDKNFEEKVLKDEKNTWFVEFYAPWCGHCKSLVPEWESAARKLKGKVKVGKLDSTTETVTSSRFDVKGFPTLILFPGGPQKEVLANRYEGPRRASDMVEYALEHATTLTEAEQLVSDDQFKETCGQGLCVVAFLPHVIDSMASGRNKYLETLRSIVRSSASMPLRFVWSQAGDQFRFEEQLNLAFGYPAVVAVNLERGKFTVHRGDYSEASIRSFLTNLMTGTAPVNDMPTLEKLKKATPWDGKDHVPEPEEEDGNDEL